MDLLPAADIARAVWESVCDAPFPADTLDLTSDAEILPSIYRVGAAATASVALAALAEAHRRGRSHRIAIDGRHASIAFRSEAYLRIDGTAPQMWAPLSGDYRTRDGWVRLHANYPQHERAVLAALGVAPERAAVEAAVAERDALDIESDVLAAGGAAAALRSRDTWLASDAGRAVTASPLIEIRRIGDAPLEEPSDRPRVLDLTRVISGPLCGKVLAGFGFDVLRIGTPALPDADALLADTGFGKRFANVDLETADGREQLFTLLRSADAFVQSHRPGSLAGRGFGAEDAARVRPGIVYVSISAYGERGPFARRRGFDSLVQLATGLADQARNAVRQNAPVALPAQALDHATGWLAAFGTLVALDRRKREGGSWSVTLSLARTAEWLASLGCDGRGASKTMPTERDAVEFFANTPSDFGSLRYVRSPLQGTQMKPPPKPGSAAPAWSPFRHPARSAEGA